MIKAVSHLVLASKNVPVMTKFFSKVFDAESCYENEEFSEFILASGFRVAFFKPLAKNLKYFNAITSRKAISIGVTVDNVDEFYEKLKKKTKSLNISLASKPKDHPWGFRSFLLIDPDLNRWEITQSPSKRGMLKEVPLVRKLKKKSKLKPLH